MIARRYPAVEAELVVQLVAVFIVVVVKTWIAMLAIGWLHDLVPQIPAIGFEATAVLSFVVGLLTSNYQPERN